jgi:hypothetical protein
LQDGVEDVYMFLDDLEGPSDSAPVREELPTAVVTMLTKCYSPSCGEGLPCYSYSCPSKVRMKWNFLSPTCSYTFFTEGEFDYHPNTWAGGDAGWACEGVVD